MTVENLMDGTADTQFDQNKNYLEELVGEGKKFASVEDLAKGKYVADIHIANLERRFDEMREDFKKASDYNKSVPKLEELLNKLEQQSASRENTHNSNENTNGTAYDPKEIETLLDNRLHQYEQTKKEQENYKLVSDKVKERFGDNYRNVLKQQAEALGLSDDDVNRMARSNPNLFLKTFDVTTNNSESFMAPPQSQQRSSFAPKGEAKRTLSYYNDLRKKNPMLYYDPKIAVQMDKDAQALGKDFFDV